MGKYFGPPTPAQTNPPIKPGYFAPSVYEIRDVILGVDTTITTAVNHNYVIGQLVRLNIPSTYGSYQLNQATGYVIRIPTTTSVVIGINSLGFNTYTASPSYAPTLAQITPVGDVNTGLISSTGPLFPTTTIPGSFINISPNVGTWFN